MQTYYIFVTGGVVSGIGKGLFAASLGMLIKSYGHEVTMQKCDPYINVDPGLMSPYQHGEVFVTDDGAETDLDLGHYERFLDTALTRLSSVTTGSIYSTVIQRERKGGYNGKTVQVVPQIVDEIKSRMRCFESTIADSAHEPAVKQSKGSSALSANAKVRFVIIEIGGTVGDIESNAFLEAIRQIIDDVDRDKACSFHVSYVPFVSGSNELKTKPTQHSVRSLLSLGIKPDFIVCRTDMPLTDNILSKLAQSCGVPKSHVIENHTISTIYELPLMIKHVPDLVFKRFGVSFKDESVEKRLSEWYNTVQRFSRSKANSGPARPCVRIGLVGKYVELGDAYLSVNEAIKHAAAHVDCDIEIVSIVSDTAIVKEKDVSNNTDVSPTSTPGIVTLQLKDSDFSMDAPETASSTREMQSSNTLDDVDAVIVPGGFGNRGIEGKIKAIRYCRKKNKPILGICLGMQCMALEFAIDVLKLKDANSTEFDAETANPIIAAITSEEVKSYNPLAATLIRGAGGNMRLGGCNCNLTKNTLAHKCYQQDVIRERHRHRYEFNGKYKKVFEKAGVIFSGLSTEGSLVEIMELPQLDFFIGVQFHPELISRPLKPHPLFVGLIKAAITKQ